MIAGLQCPCTHTDAGTIPKQASSNSCNACRSLPADEPTHVHCFNLPHNWPFVMGNMFTTDLQSH